MKTKNYIIFFGAAGSGKAYSDHTSIIPDYYIDNDKNKWGRRLKGVEINPPSILTSEFIDQIDSLVITTGYIKSVLPQLLNLGIPENKITIPAKSLLGSHPFKSHKNRIEAAEFLSILMQSDERMKVLAGGGTALGFCRDSDFIKWDFDFDLFASIKYRNELILLLDNLGCSPLLEENELKAAYHLKNGDIIPFSIKFFDPDNEIYIDIYEDHVWNWPIDMFSNFTNIYIHNFLVNVPNPPEKYLEGIYGKNWRIPNPDFKYNDYGKP